MNHDVSFELPSTTTVGTYQTTTIKSQQPVNKTIAPENEMRISSSISKWDLPEYLFIRQNARESCYRAAMKSNSTFQESMNVMLQARRMVLYEHDLYLSLTLLRSEKFGDARWLTLPSGVGNFFGDFERCLNE